MSRFKVLTRYYFNLDRDKDDEADIIASITRGISFRGTNLWTLLFAIVVASVGLNVNSTAVIIGAMLISPLMGPIMGVGLGLAIADFGLVRRGAKNLAVAVAFSIATSAIYFYLTPLRSPTPELLARTTPTIWDVFIAFAGGLAGVVGATRREKSNIIPGVAIATALMPPLCTVGYGLATHHWYFSLGAFYLFFINSVFICTATVLVVRFMQLKLHEHTDAAQKRRVNRSIFLVVVLTAAPSIWLAYRIVQKAVFEKAAERFIGDALDFPATQVVRKNLVFDAKQPRIEVLLIGQALDSLQLDSLRHRLPEYNLGKAQLVVRQGLNANQQLDVAQLKAAMLDDVFRDVDASQKPAPVAAVAAPSLPDLTGELQALYPQIVRYSLAPTVFHATSGTSLTRSVDAPSHDSVLLFVAECSEALPATDRQRLRGWLQAKFPEDSVTLILQQPTPPVLLAPLTEKQPTGKTEHRSLRR